MRKYWTIAWCGALCTLAWSTALWGQGIAPYIPNPDPTFMEDLTIQEDYRVPEPRSVFTRRDRPPDELDRPRFSGKDTHRGFDVRTQRGVFIATTSTDDARMAADIVEQTWGSLNGFADHFTNIQKHPDFAMSAVEVRITDETPTTRDEPVPVWIPGRFQSMIMINISEGRPPLEQQIPLLRAATAYVYMHVAEFDRQLPQWVLDGFAQAVVLKHDGPDGLQSLGSVPLAALRGQGLKQFREVPIELQERLLAEDQEQNEPSGSLVPFMLFADDAAHAPEFFSSLRNALQERGEQAPFIREEIVRQRQTGYQRPPLEIDSQAVTFSAEYDHWAENPDAGVPQFVGLPTDDEELAQIQRELFVVLKLANKLNKPQFASNATTNMKTKIMEFTKNGPVEKPAKSNLNAAPPPADVGDFSQLVDELNNKSSIWTTVDVDGTVVLSNDRQTVEKLQERYAQHLRARKEGDYLVWSYQLPGGRVLAGWLQPQSPDSPKMVSHFELRPAK